MWYVCVHVCICCTYICMNMCTYIWRAKIDRCLSSSLTLYTEVGSLPGPRDYNSGLPACSGDSYHIPGTKSRPPHPLTWVLGIQNCGLQTCMANTLPTKPYLQVRPNHFLKLSTLQLCKPFALLYSHHSESILLAPLCKVHSVSSLPQSRCPS